MLQFEDFQFLQCDFYVFLWTRRKKHSADKIVGALVFCPPTVYNIL